MSTVSPRDLIGYAGKPPHPKWPGDARLAVNFVINYEEGSEYNAQDDGVSEATLTEAGGRDYGVKGRDLAAEGMFEYGSRVGFWRVKRLFDERNLPLTVFGCALALERNPAVAAAIRDSNWDVCSHGWRWVKHYELSEAEERQHIRKAVESMQKTVGARPVGWYCRYGPSVNTRRLLVEEDGNLVTTTLRGGESYRIRPFTKHRMTAGENGCDIIEVSTPELEDVIRLEDRYGRA